MMLNSVCKLFVFVFLTFIYAMGLKWITEPLLVNKCKGQIANLTWEYIEDPGEKVIQHQWIFNRTKLIAYFSLDVGFNVEPKYEGRVNQSGKTGILLHNISYKDSGSYTFYPLIKWIEKPNIHTVQLNVIDPVMESNCSCTQLSDLPEAIKGKQYQIVVGTCTFEIKSSICCPVVYQYCVNDSSKFCVPIRNLNNVTESIAQSRNDSAGKELSVNLNQDNTIIYVFLGIICVMLLILIIMGGIFFAVKRYHGMSCQCQCQNPRTTRNVEELQLQDLQALQDTQQDDV